MRKITLILTVVIGLSVSGSARATLFDRGGGLIFDDVLNITWLQDASFSFTPSTLPNRTEAEAWAQALVFGNFDDWRLPSMDANGDMLVEDCSLVSEVACRDNELGYMYYYNLGGSGNDLTGDQTSISGVNIFNILPGEGRYWSSTPEAGEPNAAWAFLFDRGGQFVDGGTSDSGAWGVRDGDVAPIPEPSTMLLLGFGLAGLGLMRRRTSG